MALWTGDGLHPGADSCVGLVWGKPEPPRVTGRSSGIWVTWPLPLSLVAAVSFTWLR